MSWKQHQFWFIALIIIYLLSCIGILYFSGLSDKIDLIKYVDNFRQVGSTFLACYAILLLIYAFYILIRHRPKNAENYLKQRLIEMHGDKERLKKAAFFFVYFLFFFAAFTFMKPLIPEIKPFVWDPYFTELDYKLHFNNDPWKLLHPFLKWPLLTYLTAFLYIFWFATLYTVIYWQMFLTNNTQAQIHFFYSFFIIWVVLGTFMAIYFSSAGPCYMQEIYGSDYFMPLIQHLKNADKTYMIYALHAQDQLWYSYENNDLARAGVGISAFPSLHVATTFLIVLLVKQYAQRWLIPALIFFFAILIGSVYLGWHYAVDGYAAIILTYIIWKLVCLIRV